MDNKGWYDGPGSANSYSKSVFLQNTKLWKLSINYRAETKRERGLSSNYKKSIATVFNIINTEKNMQNTKSLQNFQYSWINESTIKVKDICIVFSGKMKSITIPKE